MTFVAKCQRQSTTKKEKETKVNLNYKARTSGILGRSILLLSDHAKTFKRTGTWTSNQINVKYMRKIHYVCAHKQISYRFSLRCRSTSSTFRLASIFSLFLCRACVSGRDNIYNSKSNISPRNCQNWQVAHASVVAEKRPNSNRFLLFFTGKCIRFFLKEHDHTAKTKMLDRNHIVRWFRWLSRHMHTK